MKKRTMRTVFCNILSGALLWTLLLTLAAPVTKSLYAQPDPKRSMTTVQYNNARTGWNPNETVLNTTNVNPNTFGRKWTKQLVGPIYGAPLYVNDVLIAGQRRNVVYVATGNNLIYALDADNNGAELWTPYSLGMPVSRRGSISPVGITGTPVIDLTTGTLYAVGLVRQGSTELYKMAAVDIATGQSLDGWPVTINPPSDIRITPSNTSERGALLLANGMVYVPFGGYFGDFGSYHGWVVGVDATNPTAQQIYFHTPGTPVRGAGIWASGGIAADDDGYVYAATGNSFNAFSVDYSNAVLKLGPDLSLQDFFMPSNWAFLNSRDIDLGSSAPLLLPPQDGSNTPNLIFITGKWGVGHLIDRDNLGGVAAGDGINGEGVYSAKVYGSAFSTAAYYNDADLGPIIFLAGRGSQPDCGTSGGVVALALTMDDSGNSFYVPFCPTPSIGSTTSPIITSASNPGQSAILWAVSFGGTLYAFDITTGDQLYSDAIGGSVRNFSHFTVVDGKVFVATSANRIVAYGLRQ